MAPSGRDRRRPPGFTLVELLVVTGLILLLMTLALAVVPRFQEKKKVSLGASQLQGWLLTAKQWAMRDQRPRGVRLHNAVLYTPMPSPAGGLSWKITYQPVNSFSYIEQPDDFVGPAGTGIYVQSVVSIPAPPPASHLPSPPFFLNIGGAFYWNPEFQGGVVVTRYQETPGVGVDFSGGYGFPVAPQWPVQVGDLMEFYSGAGARVFPIRAILQTQITSTNTVRQIALVTGPASNAEDNDPNINTYVAGADFRIVRQTRPKVGEPPLQLPTNIVVDLTVNNTHDPSNASNPSLAYPIKYDSAHSQRGWPASYRSPLPSPVPGPQGSVAFTSNIDILFSPTGAVISSGLPEGDVKLWLRDVSADAILPPTTYADYPTGSLLFNGEQFIVKVTLRTGMIAVQPLDDLTVPVSNLTLQLPPGVNPVPVYRDPYSFTRDGKASGL